MGILSREQKFAVSKGPQAAIGTLADVGKLISIRRINFNPIDPGLVVESDAGWMGKGHEFATTSYPSHFLQEYEMEAYLTSQNLAWAASNCLGSTVKTLLGPWLYTSVPQVPLTDGIEGKYLSLVQQIRDIDEGYIGVVINGFRVVLGKGPGLENSKIFIRFVGTGKFNAATGYTLPALIDEDFLTQGSLAATINGVNYVGTKQIESLEWGFDLDIPSDQGFFPGSGTQAVGSGVAAIQGRLEFRERKPLLNFAVRVEEGSDELDKLMNHTTGTAVITQGSGDHTYTVTFHQVAFREVSRADADGILIVNITGSPEFHATNGLMTVAAKTDVDGIAEV